MKDYLSKPWQAHETIRRFLKLILIIIPLAFTGNIIYILVKSGNGFIPNLENINVLYFIPAVILALMPWLGQSVGILIWGRVFDVRVSSSQALSAVLASDIGAAVTPTMLGGGYAKLALLMNFGFGAPQATLVTFLGSLADAIFFAIALPTAIILTRTWENPHVIGVWHQLTDKWQTVAVVAVVLLTILMILNKIRKRRSLDEAASTGNLVSRIVRAIAKFKTELFSAGRFVMTNGKMAFLICVLFAAMGWIGRYGAISALVAGFGYPVDPVLFFILQWVVFTTMTMIPTPGAIGGAEISFSFIYNGLIPSEAIPVIASAWRFVTFYFIVGLASLVFAAFQISTFKKRNAESGSNNSE